MRYLLSGLLVVLCSGLFCEEEAAEDFSDVSASAQRALEKYRKDCEDARLEYLKEVQDAQVDLLKVLDREIDRTTKRGELDEALALRERVRKLLQEEAIWTDAEGNPIEPVNSSDGEQEEALVQEALTAEQWDKLEGVEFVFNYSARESTRFRLGKNQRIRIVPHPTDHFTFDGRGEYFWDHFKRGLTVGTEGVRDMIPVHSLTNGIYERAGVLQFGVIVWHEDFLGSIRIKLVEVK